MSSNATQDFLATDLRQIPKPECSEPRLITFFTNVLIESETSSDGLIGRKRIKTLTRTFTRLYTIRAALDHMGRGRQEKWQLLI